MSELVTKFNEADFKLRFCSEIGHEAECVQATIDEMLYQYATMSYNYGLSQDHGIKMLYENMSVECFDAALLKLLSVKTCECHGFAKGLLS